MRSILAPRFTTTAIITIAIIVVAGGTTVIAIAAGGEARERSMAATLRMRGGHPPGADQF
jgi:hypothetical protein